MTCNYRSSTETLYAGLQPCRAIPPSFQRNASRAGSHEIRSTWLGGLKANFCFTRVSGAVGTGPNETARYLLHGAKVFIDFQSVGIPCRKLLLVSHHPKCRPVQPLTGEICVPLFTLNCLSTRLLGFLALTSCLSPRSNVGTIQLHLALLIEARARGAGQTPLRLVTVAMATLTQSSLRFLKTVKH